MNKKINSTKLLVTSYLDPDLDGFACSFAYAEFLRKNGKDAIAAIFGTPHREAEFVLNIFKIHSLQNAETLNYENIILVDTSNLTEVSPKILPEKVIEIIDHRKLSELHKFPNATSQIELVGSAATLIAEKFYKTDTTISVESAELLFSAIVSNTINFKAGVTTIRDHKMADWLKTKFKIPKDYINKMFADKSKFKKPLKEILNEDVAVFYFNKCSLSILQLEIINVDDFIKKNLKEIKKIMLEIKKEKSIGIIFLTCIDLEKSFNLFVVIDKKTQDLLTRIFNSEFKDGVSKRDGILMRKEITPLIKEMIDKEN